MTDHPIDPQTGLYRNDYGTVITPATDEARRRRRAAEIDAAIRERQESAAALEAQRERERTEAAECRLAAYREQQKRQWVAATGSEAGFESAWPKLREAFATSRDDLVAREIAALRARPEYQI